MNCRHGCCTLRSLNVYHLRFALCTICKCLLGSSCQSAFSSSVTYQCILHIRYCSFADKLERAMRMIYLAVSVGMISTLAVSPPFLSGSSQLSETLSVVSGPAQTPAETIMSRYVIDIHGSHIQGYHNLFRLHTQGSLTSSSAVHTTEQLG